MQIRNLFSQYTGDGKYTADGSDTAYFLQHQDNSDDCIIVSGLFREKNDLSLHIRRSMLYLLIFSGSLLAVIFFTPYLISILTKFKVVDYPGGRKKHTKPVPRMGGLLIYIPLIVFLLMFWRDRLDVETILPASGIILLCGILDDVKGLNWYIKYLMHSASAVIILLYLYPGFKEISLFGLIIPPPFDLIILYFFITGVINSVNMLDGLDGLVSGAGLLLFMLIFMLSYVTGNPLLMIVSASLTGSLIGFLKFNAFPAKIFLGDTGSLTIGFFLALSVLILSNNIGGTRLELGFSVMLLGVPIIDTLKVMLFRIYKGKSPFLPDRSHIHHKIEDNKIHHKHTVFIIQLFTVAFIFLAVYYVYFNRMVAFSLFVCLGSVLMLFSPFYRLTHKLKPVIEIIISLIYDKRFTIDLYRKILLPGSSLIIILIVLFMFPSDAKASAEIIAMMIAVCALLFVAALLSFKRYHGLNDLYVLLNLYIFFILSDSGEPYIKLLNIAQLNSYVLLDIGLAIILGFIGLFLLFREKIFGKKVSLFSGLDLIMMIFVLFILILQNFVPAPSLNFLGANLFTGFTIYIWYKMVMIMVPAVSRRIYVLAFILPAAMFISLVW